MPIPTLKNGQMTFIEGALYPKSVIGRETEIEDRFSKLMESPLYEIENAKSVALSIYKFNNLPTKAGVYLVRRDGSRRAQRVASTVESARKQADLMLQCTLGRANLHSLADLGFLLAPNGQLHVASQILTSVDRWRECRAAGQHDAATKFAIDAVVNARAIALEITQAENLTVGHKWRSGASEGGRARKSCQSVTRKTAYIHRFIKNYRDRHPEAPVTQIYRDFRQAAPEEHLVKLSRFYEIAAH